MRTDVQDSRKGFEDSGNGLPERQSCIWPCMSALRLNLDVQASVALAQNRTFRRRPHNGGIAPSVSSYVTRIVDPSRGRKNRLSVDQVETVDIWT
jgi:hypothetical protein